MPLSCSNLGYSYPGARKAAFSGISFTLEAGEVVGLTGPCASGKSTFLACLSGALEPTRGNIRLNSRMTKNLPNRKRLMAQQIALVQQFPERQFFAETVFDEVAFGPKNQGLSGEELTGRVNQALGQVGLDAEAFKDRSPFSLSGGEQRRLAIANMLALQPEYLLLDEPNAGLDAAACAQLGACVQSLAAAGMGVLVVSHSADFLAQMGATHTIEINELQDGQQQALPSPDVSAASAGFGVYEPGTSFMHKLDPRAKIVLSLLFIVAAFAAHSYLGLAVVAAAVIALLALSDSSNEQLIAALKPFLWLMVFILVFNGLFTPGGIVVALESLVRFVLVVLGTSMLMRTTSPTELADGISLLLRPLERLGVRTCKFSLATQLTFRFVPTITQEFERIKAAQEARLANFESRSVVERVKAYAPVITPLMVGAFRRSDMLALAIQNREFGQHPNKQRTSLRNYIMQERDWAALAAATALLLLTIIL